MATKEFQALQQALQAPATPEAMQQAAAAFRQYHATNLSPASLGMKSRPMLVSLGLGTSYPSAIPVDQIATQIETNPDFYNLMKKVIGKPSLMAILGMPDFDLPTRSASGFLLRWIAPRMGPFQLISQVDRKQAWGVILGTADLVVATGHGAPDEFTGQSEQLILQATQLPNVQGKFFKLLSCQTGVYSAPL